jgi:hypothetical protein
LLLVAAQTRIQIGWAISLTLVGVCIPSYLHYQQMKRKEAKQAVVDKMIVERGDDTLLIKQVYDQEMAFRARVDAEIAARKQEQQQQQQQPDDSALKQ